jgi:multiple sugar transport system permease protein
MIEIKNLKIRNKKHRKRHSPIPFRGWLVICVSLSILFLSPILASLLHSLKRPSDSAASPPGYIPREFSFENYRKLADSSGGLISDGIMLYVSNSLLLALITVLGSLFLSTLAGYGFARFKFRGRGLFFGLILLMIMVPFQALLTPIYFIFSQVGLQNSLIGLSLIYITYQLPFSIFLMRNTFMSIPVALGEAAMIDGCSPFKTFRSVMLPLAKPGIISVALFAFFASWNEFIAALSLISVQEKYSLPVVLTLLGDRQMGATNFGFLQAGVVVTMLPCIALFLVLQKYYVNGLISGSVKA